MYPIAGPSYYQGNGPPYYAGNGPSYYPNVARQTREAGRRKGYVRATEDMERRAERRELPVQRQSRRIEKRFARASLPEDERSPSPSRSGSRYETRSEKADRLEEEEEDDRLEEEAYRRRNHRSRSRQEHQMMSYQQARYGGNTCQHEMQYYQPSPYEYVREQEIRHYQEVQQQEQYAMQQQYFAWQRYVMQQEQVTMECQAIARREVWQLQQTMQQVDAIQTANAAAKFNVIGQRVLQRDRMRSASNGRTPPLLLPFLA